MRFAIVDARRRSAGARVLVALAMVLGILSVARFAAAQSCPSACDLSCQTCCSHWKLRGACPGGEMKDDGDFRTFDAAQRAADSRNTCAPGDAECARHRNVCSGGSVAALWAVACDTKDRLAPPSDSEARRSLEAAGAALAASAKSVDESQAALATFARTHTVRDRGVARAAIAVDAVRASRDRLRELRAEQERLLLRVTSAADAHAFSERASAAIKSASDAVAAATAMTTDPTIVDTTAEDRERWLAAAQRAREDEEAKRKAARDAEEARRQAAIATAQEEARRRNEDAEQRRKEAEAGRIAAAEASKRKLEEQQAQQQANAAASSAEKKKLAEQKHDTIAKGLGDVDTQLTAALATVASTLAIANVSRDQRARAQANDQRIRALQARAKDVRARADGALQAAPAAALATVSRAEVELAVLASEARIVTASAGAPVITTTAPGAAGSKEVAPVPTCVVDVVAPAGLTGTTVALDGAKPVPLPAKVRVSSGRHALAVSRGTQTVRQSELVVCGRVATIAVNAPK